MIYLYIGIALFFGLHIYSTFRCRTAGSDIKARVGQGVYMGGYSLLSVIGLGLIIYGYAAMPPGELLYTAQPGARMVSLIANTVAIALLAASYLPMGYLKALVRHPMVAGLTLWAGAHLYQATDLKQLLLFGSFLLFGIVNYIAANLRPTNGEAPKPSALNDVIALAIGIGVSAALVYGLHALLFGAMPL